MLIGISHVIGPDLLSALHRMGHGDEIVLGDAHMPGETLNQRVLRADGVRICDLLDGILPLFALDEYVAHPVVMMAAIEGDTLDPTVEQGYWKVIYKHWPNTPPIERIERSAFYERTRKAFALVISGETAKYGDIILTKGVTPC